MPQRSACRIIRKRAVQAVIRKEIFMQTEENIYANPVPLPDEPILESFKKFIKKDDSDERLLAFLAKESEIVLRKRELRGLT